MQHAGQEPLCRGWVAPFLLFWFCFSTNVLAAGVNELATTRVVSLLPTFTEIAFELQASEMLVGVSDYCRFPAAAREKPQVGGLLNPHLERILALRPTLVVLSESQTDLRMKLTQLQIPVQTFRTDTLSDVFEVIRKAGAVFGRQEAAQKVEHRLRECLRRLESESSHQKQCKVLLVVSRQPASLRDVYVAGPQSYLGELLHIAGGVNVAAQLSRAYAPLSKEDIIAANPEVILDFSLGEFGENPEATQRHLAAWSDLATLEAVRKKQVYAISDPHTTIPGPFMCETAQLMAKFLRESCGRSE